MGDIEGAICDECESRIGPNGCCSTRRAERAETEKLATVLHDIKKIAIEATPTNFVIVLDFSRPKLYGPFTSFSEAVDWTKKTAFKRVEIMAPFPTDDLQNLTKNKTRYAPHFGGEKNNLGVL